jgi:hypothetical protein
LERGNPALLPDGSSYEAQVIANKALYDAINESILGVYKSANRIQAQIAHELVDLDKSVSLRKKLELVEEKTRVSGAGAATHGLGSLQPLRPLGGGLQPLRTLGHL